MTNEQEISRRLFMIKSCAGLGALWLAENLTEIVAAQEHAHQLTQSGSPAAFQVFNSDQAADVEALAEQILPTDETPGAKEARVVYFIDRAMATFAASDRAAFLEGLAKLDKRAKKRAGKTKRFAQLTPDQQTRLLKEIEKDSFFDLARTMTILGMFSNPEYGGNHDQIGWKLIGFEDQFHFKSPYGFYDTGYQPK